MRLKPRIMLYWVAAHRSPKSANLRWWLALPWGGCDEHRRPTGRHALDSYPDATGDRLLGVPRNRAHFRQEFLLRIHGTAQAETGRLMRCLRFHAALRRPLR